MPFGPTHRWRLIKLTSASLGYLRFSPMIDGRKRTFRVHHTVLLAFVGPPGEGQERRHLDGHPGINRLSNLCWGTRLENAADKVRPGTQPRGERCKNVKLSDAQRAEIRAEYAALRTSR